MPSTFSTSPAEYQSFIDLVSLTTDDAHILLAGNCLKVLTDFLQLKVCANFFSIVEFKTERLEKNSQKELSAMNISKSSDGVKIVLDGCDALIPESQLKQLRATAKTGHKNSQRDCDDDTVHRVRTARKGRVILTLLNGGADSRIEMIPFRCRKAIASRILPSAEAVKLLKVTKGS